jgi:hypothetical protein
VATSIETQKRRIVLDGQKERRPVGEPGLLGFLGGNNVMEGESPITREGCNAVSPITKIVSFYRHDKNALSLAATRLSRASRALRPIERSLPGSNEEDQFLGAWIAPHGLDSFEDATLSPIGD